MASDFVIHTAEELLDKGARNSDKNKVNKLSRFGRIAKTSSVKEDKRIGSISHSALNLVMRERSNPLLSYVEDY